MVQAEFLKSQNQVMQVSESKFEFALRKRKKRKDKRLLKLSGMYANDFKFFSEDNFKIGGLWR